MSFENASFTKGLRLRSIKLSSSNILLLGLVLACALTSIFAGIFDVKHYFHLQVGHFFLPPLHESWPVLLFSTLVCATYLATSPSKVIQPFLQNDNTLNMLILVLASTHSSSRFLKFKWLVRCRTIIVQRWGSNWTTVWEFEICGESWSLFFLFLKSSRFISHSHLFRRSWRPYWNSFLSCYSTELDWIIFPWGRRR